MALRQDDIPHISTEKMREVDRIMEQRYHIDLKQMMELAGFHIATLASRLISEKPMREASVGILAGTGGNGGGALVAARHLANKRTNVKVFLAKPIEKYTGITGQQLNILRKMNVPLAIGKYMRYNRSYDMLIDGLIGYSLQGKPRDMTEYMIKCANKQSGFVLSVDVPSGMDATTGEAEDPCIRADTTITLALPKSGFKHPDAPSLTGDLYLANIGVPPPLYQLHAICFKVPDLFEKEEIVKITR